jgi:hypothetical protein
VFITVSGPWLLHDCDCCHALKFGTREEKLAALRTAIGQYGIARNLPLSGDEKKGLPRLKPLLDVIETVKHSDFRPDPVPAIRQVSAAISKRYGGRGKLSMTTKVLWLALKRPIIIYDSQARLALGTRAGDLEGFYAEWRRAFQTHAARIAKACEKLGKMGVYSVEDRRATPKYIHKVATTRWFHERVFDFYLWNKGNG